MTTVKLPKTLKLIFLIMSTLGVTYAAPADTLKAKNIQEMESRLDSLYHIINTMDDEIQHLKKNMIEGKSGVDELLSLLNDENVESMDMETRSKKSRVDALLRALTQQPGKLQFNGGATTILQNSDNRKSRYSQGTASFDIYAHTAFNENTLLFFDLEAIGGNGPDRYFPSLAGLNGDAGSTQDEDGIDRLTILEAWTEMKILHNIFTITAGKIDLTNYFDNNASANDETMQFISGSFINSAALAVPSNSPGMRVQAALFDRYHFHFGLSSIHNSGDDMFKKIYRIAGIGWTLFPGSEFESNVRFYGYQHPLADNAFGWGISWDKILFNSYNLFGRYGQNEDKIAAFWGVQSAWSIGARFVRTIFDQTLAIGIAYGENTSYLKTLKTEKLMEIYLRRQLNRWIHISPLFQYVWNSNGSLDKIIVFGLRTHYNF